jgi:REP element-mobilizing transposase RayT
MCRGNDRNFIFKEPRDAELFLNTLGETVNQNGWLIHAYVLMGNHYHLLLETPEPNLVKGMKWFQGAFTQRYHKLHRTCGHLYQGRYKAKIIDDGDPSYFLEVSNYIHLNPLEARLIESDPPDLSTYPWSSCRYYHLPPSKRPDWLVVDRVLESLHITRDDYRGRRAYAAYQAERAAWLVLERSKKSFRKHWNAFTRGWYLGSDSFQQRMLDLMKENQASSERLNLLDHQQRRAYHEHAAEKALQAGLQLVALSEEELARTPKRDPRKMLLGGWLKSNYSVSNQWIADRLKMGHITTVSQSGKVYQQPGRQWKGIYKKLNELNQAEP